MKLKNNQIFRIFTTVLVAIFVLTIVQELRIEKMKIKIENNYNRAFYELTSYVDDIETLLEKSMLVSSATQISTISSELFRMTTSAKACLGQLPISEIKLENTEKFLSQTGDYTYTLSQNVINKKTITDEEYKTLEKLCSYAGELNKTLTKMQTDLYDNKISFSKMDKSKNGYNVAYAKNYDIKADLEDVEQKFHEYPSLIYDGPFSEHIDSLKSNLLENKDTISQNEALKKAQSILGDKGKNLKFTNKSINTKYNSYSFRGTYKNGDVFISITEKGGYPIYFINTEKQNSEKLSINEAKEKAMTFLNKIGFNNMTDSYYDKSDNIATINFAYKQNDVICYSDLVKVKVSLEDGEILGFESKGYIMNHKTRQLSKPKLTEKEAKKLINKHLSIDSVKLALIPKDSKREVLSYEFKGNHNGKNFLIYINVETGAEEQILMLIESENGILSV